VWSKCWSLQNLLKSNISNIQVHSFSIYHGKRLLYVKYWGRKQIRVCLVIEIWTNTELCPMKYELMFFNFFYQIRFEIRRSRYCGKIPVLVTVEWNSWPCITVGQVLKSRIQRERRWKFMLYSSFFSLSILKKILSIVDTLPCSHSAFYILKFMVQGMSTALGSQHHSCHGRNPQHFLEGRCRL